MSNFSKRGVSAVVATVLIIMITVAAIGIIWVAIVPMIKDNLSGSIVCNDADLSIEILNGYTCYDSVNNIVAVQVVKGTNEVNVSGLKFLISSLGSSISYSTDFVFERGESKIFYINTSILTSVDQIFIVPILTDGAKEKECPGISSNSIPNCSLRVVGEEILVEDSCKPNCSCAANLVIGNTCSDGCGGNCGGIRPSWVYDESFDGNAKIVYGNYTEGGLIYFNYTKPSGATNNSKWLVKHGDLEPYNITIPQECWNADSNKLILMFRSNGNLSRSNTFRGSRPYCFYNGSAIKWYERFKEVGELESTSYRAGGRQNTLTHFFSDGDWDTYIAVADGNLWSPYAPIQSRFYEEAMWWEIAN